MNSPNQRRKDPKLIASAILIALIVIAAIVLIGTRLTGGDDGSAAAPTQTKSSSPSKPSSTCGLPDGNQTVPSSTPPKTTWALNAKMATPKSSLYGPGTVSAGVGSCFAHSPTGALFAAATYLVDASNPNISVASLRSRFTAASPPIDATDDRSAAPNYQISGYRFDDVTADRATVSVAVRVTEGPSAGGQVALTFTLKWEEADWRIVVPGGGDIPSAGITSLAGFTPWAGA